MPNFPDQPAELAPPAVPTAPAPSVAALDGLGGVTSPSVPTPGVSSSVARVPTSPTLPDDPTHFTALVAQLATSLYGVDGAGFDGAPERAASHASGGEVPAFSPSVPTPSAIGALPAFDVEPAFALPLTDGAAGSGGGLSSSGGLAGPTGIDRSAPPEPVASRAALAHEPSGDARPYFLDELGVRPTTAESLAGFAVPSALEPHLGVELGPAVVAAHEPRASTPRPRGDGFDAYALREEFPILKERVHGGKRLVWLDNAATTQKPEAVIERLAHFYRHENSNIHRAAHALAARATDAYEAARESVRRFLRARSTREVVFARGTTEAINLVAQSWGRRYLEPGDEIVVTWLEHHANIVPWQLLAKERGLRLKVAPVDDDGQVLLDEYERLFTSRTKLASVTQVSNALGTVTPAKAMIDIAHRHGARVLLDGAQSVSHMRVDLQALDCDFFVFSGHKVFAPTGIGALVAREDVLESMPPWQGGGNMIQDVTFERTLFHGPPARFEAGTGNIADAVGLGAALDWLERVGIEHVSRHEHELLEYGTARLREIPGLRMIGTAKEKAGVLSFVVDGHATSDIATYLDKEGIAVRGGHHCAQPILRRFGLESTVRASLAPYNVREDLDALVDALRRLTASGRR